jgi:hypothetical protein
MLYKLKIKPINNTLYSKLSEVMEGTHEHNDHRKSPKTNFTLSSKRTKINWTSSEEMGGK